MEKELISVIVPVYNVETYLDRCVSSIVNQTYKNLEIILVDDGSTDRSGDMCDAWLPKDKRIRVIHKENGGLSSARNAGMEQAKGQFWGFIDSDDYIAPDMYEYLYKNRVNGGICACGYIEVDERNRKRKRADSQHFIAKGTYDFEEAVHLYIKDEWEKDFCGGVLHLGSYAWNKLYDRCVFKEVRFPHGKKYEDMYVILKLLHNATSFKSLPECKYYYVQRDGSIIHEIGTVHIDSLTARIAQLEQARQFPLNEENLRLLEMLVVKAHYDVYRDVLRLPASEAVAYYDIAEECKAIVYSEMFKQVPFSFKRRFWMKILTAPLYKLFWKWKRH